jgi:hypothetical protein
MLNFYIFNLYRNPDLDDRIFDCMLTSMAAIQAEDVKASFLFMGDLNAHHQNWLGSMTTNRHGVAALDFSTVAGCDQLVIGPTHVRGGTLDLLMTDVPDLVQVSVLAPVGRSDHSTLSVRVSSASSVPNLCESRSVFMKRQVNWDTVGDAVRELPWHTIWKTNQPVEVLNQHLSSLIERFIPTKVIRLRNKDKPWFNDDCRRAFDLKQCAYHRWTRDRSQANWSDFSECQRSANGVYGVAEGQYNAKCKDVLLNATNSHKWWSTLKSAVFGSESSIPPLIREGGGLVCESQSKAVLLADHFDGKQSRDSLNLPPSCHPCPVLTTFAFRSSEVKRLLLDLDSYGGTDPLGMFPLFFKKLANVLAPKLSVLFRKLIRLGGFSECWRVANVTPVPKGSPSPLVTNYRPISITSVLSKVFERLLSVRLGRFMERTGVFPPTQFAYRKGLGTSDALLCVSHALQSALDCGQEARVVQLDFSAAFDRVNHVGIVYKLQDAGVGGSFLSILSQFLAARSQYVVVDGARSHLVDVVSGVPQGSVLGPLLFLLYTSELFSNLENKLYGYADDSTLVSVVPSPHARISVSQSINRDLVKISDWCCLWGMKLNASKTVTMIVSRSRTVLPPSPALVLDGVTLDESSDLVILGVTLDSKMTFEKHIRSVARAASQKLGIMRRSWCVFHDHSLSRRCFNSFVLPILEYCSAVWCSAADSHLRLLDRVVTSARFLVGGELDCDLGHRRSVAALCMLYKIRGNMLHPLNSSLPYPYVPARVTRGAVAAHQFAYAVPRARTSQYGRTFIPWSVSLWNGFDASVFDGVGLCGFKSRANRLLLA